MKTFIDWRRVKTENKSDFIKIFSCSGIHDKLGGDQ